MTHVEFDINWSEVGKVVAYIAIGAFIAVAIIAYIFRNFKPY
jgi:uncharacterized membrane protein YraQ (UPF0718 family)